jgi:ABC-2 type transport system ATP-binding protein
MPAFLTTHYIDETKHVDKVCIINHGQIAMTGSPDEMKQSLVKQEIVLDVEDREQFVNELSDMRLLAVQDVIGVQLTYV